MKFSLVAVVILMSLNSYSCSTYEAQFSSIVKEVLSIEGEPYACWLKLDVNLGQAGQTYRPHAVCPLDIEEIYDGRIYSSRCSFLPGDEISGYLVKNPESRVELE